MLSVAQRCAAAGFGSSRVRVLIATVVNFTGIARLPRALSVAGWEVGVLCPEGSYLEASRYIDRRFLIKAPPGPRKHHRQRRLKQQTGSGYLTTLNRAIESWRPDIVLPGDEPTARFLHRLVQLARSGRTSNVSTPVLAVLERSLGDADRYGVLLNKRETLALARSLGIATPEQTRADSLHSTLAAAREIGYPVVLKRAISYGGDGVFVCADENGLRDAWRRCTGWRASLPRRLENLGRRAIRDELGLAWHPMDRIVDVQRFIAGKKSSYFLAAVRGRSISGFAVLSEEVDKVTGALAVVRFVENHAMSRAASLLAAHCGYTGFFQLDCMTDGASGETLLLECNPRPTPVTHLGALVGADLCAALYAGLNGNEWSSSPGSNAGAVVALFPQEWARDTKSRYLHEVYHDVPWDEPELVRAYAKTVR